MSLSPEAFLGEIATNPALAAISLLAVLVILINGWTEAPNAIATCVSTRALSIRKAILLAAVFNFLGLLSVTLAGAKVAWTIYSLAEFGGTPAQSLAALCGAMTAILVWTVAAWKFGIPTSEGHALIAGITGSAIALQGGLGGIHGQEWMKVLYGMFLAILLGFAGGFLLSRILARIFSRVERQKTTTLFMRAQIGASAGMAFMHGAQDGQKFIAVFLLGIYLAGAGGTAPTREVPVWLVILLSLLMALGTAVGGRRIIKRVGLQMVRLEPYQGFSADAAAAFSLLAASLFGLPVSTTHTKTSAIIGVGVARRASSVKWVVFRDIAATWLLTFPGCGLLGWLTTSLFLILFR